VRKITPTPGGKDYELCRHHVSLEEIIGEGQFGSVYRGIFRRKDSSHLQDVAIKTCKPESERLLGNQFLEEAFIMQQFDHPNIMKLIGVCSDSPIWLVMELADYGEMRAFLQKNKSSLSLTTLLLFAYQLSTALSYLESKQFVHRDIAARNVLVSSPECAKLVKQERECREDEAWLAREEQGMFPTLRRQRNSMGGASTGSSLDEYSWFLIKV